MTQVAVSGPRVFRESAVPAGWIVEDQWWTAKSVFFMGLLRVSVRLAIRPQVLYQLHHFQKRCMATGILASTTDFIWSLRRRERSHSVVLVIVRSFANATQLPPAGVHECLQVAVIETETDIFASSTCYYNIMYECCPSAQQHMVRSCSPFNAHAA